MNLEMEGREEQDRELVRAAACRLTLSLMALYKLFIGHELLSHDRSQKDDHDR